MIDDYPEYENYSCKTIKKTVPVPFPPQHQDKYPGLEYLMNPKPLFDVENYTSDRLKDKVAIITGGDSGIGKSASILLCRNNCNIIVNYLEREEKDAQFTKNYIDNIGKGKCILCSGDIADPKTSKKLVNKALDEFGHLTSIVNNAAMQIENKSILDVSNEELLRIFEVNVFGCFYLVKAALPYLKSGDSIVNTTSIVSYVGSKTLLSYSSSKGALSTFTKSLAKSLVDKNIRVNAIAPGPIYSPLQMPCWDAETNSMFGADNLMGRAGQPFEVANAFLYLVSDDSRYITGSTIHVNGGDYMN